MESFDKNKPMNEVIHDEWVGRYEEAGVPIPDQQEVLSAIKAKDENIVDGNCVLTIDGVTVEFPQSWQNGLAMVEKVYSDILEAKKSS